MEPFAPSATDVRSRSDVFLVFFSCRLQFIELLFAAFRVKRQLLVGSQGIPVAENTLKPFE